MNYIFLSHSFVGGHLGGLISWLLWTVQCRCASISVACWPVVLQIHPQERGTAGTCDTFYFCVVFFFFFENLHTDFHNDYTSLHFHQQRTRVPLCLYLICLCSSDFSTRVTLTGERKNLQTVLMCILMAEGEEQFSRVYGIHISTLESCLFSSLSSFWIGWYSSVV